MDHSQLPGEEIREMLRDSLRGFLGEHGSGRGGEAIGFAGSHFGDLDQACRAGRRLLGCDFSEGGLREILVVMAELGRRGLPSADVVGRAHQSGAVGLSCRSRGRFARKDCMMARREWRFPSGRSILTRTPAQFSCGWPCERRACGLLRSPEAVPPRRGGRGIRGRDRRVGGTRCRPGADPGHGHLGTLRNSPEIGANEPY